MGIFIPLIWFIILIGFIMFGVALDIRVEDFRRIVRDPRGPAIGLAAQFLLLPALTLAVVATGVIARLTRASMLEVLRQDYIRTARAKGLPEVSVIWRQDLPAPMLLSNASSPPSRCIRATSSPRPALPTMPRMAS